MNRRSFFSRLAVVPLAAAGVAAAKPEPDYDWTEYGLGFEVDPSSYEASYDEFMRRAKFLHYSMGYVVAKKGLSQAKNAVVKLEWKAR